MRDRLFSHFQVNLSKKTFILKFMCLPIFGTTEISLEQGAGDMALLVTTCLARKALFMAVITTRGVRNENISKFRFVSTQNCFVLVSFRNPSNFVSLCARNQTAKGWTLPM